MKLYEVNQMIEGIFEQLVDPETGEIVENEALLAQLDSLQMERSRILEYLAKLVLNTRSQMAALKEEEKRLKERRASLERKDTRLMEILDRECAGEKTDCGVATVCKLLSGNLPNPLTQIPSVATLRYEAKSNRFHPRL